MGRKLSMEQWFQHTAARRRLHTGEAKEREPKSNVSTHSRAEAAALVDNLERMAETLVSTHSRAEAAAT